jgi:anaerobic magnesium-protoporphyrin IX monomethyl ester cyclase
MARVFIINPPSPEPVKTPLLSFCHLAASLRRAGHEVALLDASAPFAPRDPDEIAARVAAFDPDLVGLHLKTLHVQPAYALATRLSPHFTLVAGGPHATVCPEEPLDHGFRFVVRGEGEEALVELAAAVAGDGDTAAIAGLSERLRPGPLGVRHNPDRGFIRDLDALASPVSALDLFDPTWYSDPAGGDARPVPFAGLLSSRGCPAACTFCSNNVTGRRFRYRSPGAIIEEIRELQARFGMRAFAFFDDSFAVGHRRVRELCAALETLRPPHAFPVHWTCTAHPAHLDPTTLSQMKAAGCGGIDLGIESGDPGMLVRIGKGVTVDRVLDVLGWCRDLGLHTMVNLMFGWPDETDEELEATLEFMRRAAPLCSGFNARGVLVPYPGTLLYDRHHERFGFTGWWLREPPLAYEPFPTAWSSSEVLRCYATDPALDRNFFQHPPRRLDLIAEALRQKAEHTLGAIARHADAAAPRPPAASHAGQPIRIPAPGASAR